MASTYRQMQRWTVSPAARVEILDRLLRRTTAEPPRKQSDTAIEKQRAVAARAHQTIKGHSLKMTSATEKAKEPASSYELMTFEPDGLVVHGSTEFGQHSGTRASVRSMAPTRCFLPFSPRPSIWSGYIAPVRLTGATSGNAVTLSKALSVASWLEARADENAATEGRGYSCVCRG